MEGVTKQYVDAGGKIGESIHGEQATEMGEKADRQTREAR